MKTREDLIDEMAKAIYATGVALDGTDYAFGVYDDDDHFHRMASALIEAGIGDVSAVKAEQEEIKLFNAEIKNGEIDMTVGSAGFKTFFALVEQIFKQNGATAFLTTTIEGGNDIKYAVTIQRFGEKSPAEELRQATELWKHEKHRAEVAERALLRLCEETMRDKLIIMYPVARRQVRDKQELYDYCIEKAERELAEGGKDG